MKKSDTSTSNSNVKTSLNYQTPLYTATRNGYSDCVKEILEIPGVDPFFKPNPQSDIAFVLMLCSETIDQNSKMEIIMLYLEKFGIEFIKNIKSPLCLSARYCSIAEINIFLKPEYFANVTIHDYYPWEYASGDLVKNYLLQHKELILKQASEENPTLESRREQKMKIESEKKQKRGFDLNDSNKKSKLEHVDNFGNEFNGGIDEFSFILENERLKTQLQQAMEESEKEIESLRYHSQNLEKTFQKAMEEKEKELESLRYHVQNLEKTTQKIIEQKEKEIETLTKQNQNFKTKIEEYKKSIEEKDLSEHIEK